MLEATLILCAEKIILEKSNVISAISIIEQINTSSFPVFFPKLYVLGVFRRADGDPDTYQLKLGIDNNDQNVIELETPLNFLGQQTGKVIAEISNVAISQPGQLHARFDNVNEHLATYNMEVRALTPPEGNVQLLTSDSPESTG